MNLSEEVDLEDYVGRPDKISNAEIAAICQEAGMHAVRKNRYIILPKDFEKVLFFIPSGILQHNGQKQQPGGILKQSKGSEGSRGDRCIPSDFTTF